MPLTGGSIGAQTGRLTLLVGGNEKELEKIKTILGYIAQEVKYFGEVGAGTKYKLILNSVQAIHMIAFGEAIKMAKQAGLDLNLVGDALVARPGGTSTKISCDALKQDPKDVSFSAQWMAKDLGYAVEMLYDRKSPLLEIANKQ